MYRDRHENAALAQGLIFLAILMLLGWAVYAYPAEALKVAGIIAISFYSLLIIAVCANLRRRS
jgi:hypothetical protein